jgi:hypothetical protein
MAEPRSPSEIRRVREARTEEWNRLQGTIGPQIPPQATWPGGQGHIYPGSMGGGTFPTYPPSGPTSGPMSGAPPLGSAASTADAINRLLQSVTQAGMAGGDPWNTYKLAIRNLNPPGRFNNHPRNWDPSKVYPHIANQLGLAPNQNANVGQQMQHIWNQVNTGVPQGNIPTAVGGVLGNVQGGIQNHPITQMLPHPTPNPATLPPHWLPPSPPPPQTYPYPPLYGPPQTSGAAPTNQPLPPRPRVIPGRHQLPNLPPSMQY